MDKIESNDWWGAMGQRIGVQLEAENDLHSVRQASIV